MSLPGSTSHPSGGALAAPAGRRSPARVFAITAVVAAALLGLSCASAGGSGLERAELTPDAPLTSDGLAMVRSTPRARLWVRPDHHLGRYDAIQVTGIGFQYGQGQTRLNDSQEEQVGEMLVDAIASITEGTPVGESATSGPCVVSLQVGLKDIFLHLGEASQGSSISYVSSFGSATMVVEFRDSTSQETLLRYAANRGLGGGPGTGQIGANLGRLGKALGRMVTDMTTELQTIVPDTTVRNESECNDGIYRMTGRG